MADSLFKNDNDDEEDGMKMWRFTDAVSSARLTWFLKLSSQVL